MNSIARLCAATMAIGVAALSMVDAAHAAETVHWPRWRGPEDSGSSAHPVSAVRWDSENVLWKVRLPGKGCSTPAIWGGRIFVTAPTNGLDAVLAFDLEGTPLWITTLGYENPGKHQNGSGSNPSPATDGQAVFVNFKSGSLAALEFDGRIRWQTNLVERFGRDTLFWDHGTSPVLTENSVVLARMHHGESWLAAFDKETGAMPWKVSRNYETPTEGDHGYTTPLLISHHGKPALLVWGGQHLTAHDPANGGVLWSCGDFNPAGKAFWPAVASSVVAGDIAIVPFGRADRGEPRLHGVRLGGTGDVTSTHRLWLRDDVGTFVPTPSVSGKRVYILGDRGEVECIDAATGKTLWSGAFPKASTKFYASPLVASDKLYAIREDGVVFVGSTEEPFRVLAENRMGERVIASPVPLGERLLIRGEQHLFCVGTREQREE
jgi:outer membrane protein assembly factor BamB